MEEEVWKFGKLEDILEFACNAILSLGGKKNYEGRGRGGVNWLNFYELFKIRSMIRISKGKKKKKK